MLRIAIQKTGRLSEDSIQLIQECGIRYNQPKNKLRCEATNFPLEILFLRDDDIPETVSNGVADIGIVGENVVAEKNKSVQTILSLGFAKCRLSIAVRNGFSYQAIQDLEGIDIATSYPNLLSKHLEAHQVQATIHEISGSVEIAPSIGLAPAICDLVSSGSTLISNGLKEVDVIFRSEAVLIASPSMEDAKQEILQDLLFRIRSVLRAKNTKYILLNIPNHAIDQVIELLPGMRSPSILPLAESGWSSIHSVINEADFWENIQRLKDVGAQGILIIPIEKMVL